METRANFVLVGSFALAMIAAAFGFVFWFQSLGSASQRTPLRIVFEGSASGLRTGGNVNFNGVKIGEVTSVKLDDPKMVVVLVMVDKAAPIRRDTLVGLEFAGLTGVSSVSLKGGSLTAPGVPTADDGVPTLTADPNATQDIGDAVRASLQNLSRLVNDNQELLHRSILNLEVFTKSLSNSAARIDSIMLGVENLMGAKEGQESELQQAARSVRELTVNLDKRTAELIISGRRTLLDISRAVNNFDRNPSRILFGTNSSEPAAATPGPSPSNGKVRR